MIGTGKQWRRTILGGLFGLPMALRAHSAAPEDGESSYRLRWMPVDSVFKRARKARPEQLVSYSAYLAIMKLLREEELAIFGDARAHSFTGETEAPTGIAAG